MHFQHLGHPEFVLLELLQSQNGHFFSVLPAGAAPFGADAGAPLAAGAAWAAPEAVPSPGLPAATPSAAAPSAAAFSLRTLIFSILTLGIPRTDFSSAQR